MPTITNLAFNGGNSATSTFFGTRHPDESVTTSVVQPDPIPFTADGAITATASFLGEATTGYRLYLPWSASGSDTAPVSPAYGSQWDTIGAGAVRRPTTMTKTGSALAQETSANFAETSATGGNLLHKQFVGPPIGAQTISGTFSAVIRGLEATTNVDASLQVVLRVVSNDGTVERGVLYAGHTAAVNSTNGALGQELPTAQATRIIPAGTALTPVVTQNGDRVVVEVGHKYDNVLTTSQGALLRFGDDNSVGDFPLTAGLTSDLNPWVELSMVPVPAAIEGDGTLSVSAAIAGAATVALGADGALTATATITGSAAVTRPAAGTVTATATIAGTATPTRVADGAVSVAAGITGTATPTRVVTGSQTVTATLTGDATTTRSATGSVTATASITGSAAVTRPADGSFTATATLTGAATRTVGVAGSVTTTASITGSAAVTRLAQGSLTVTAAITGSTSAVVTGSQTVTAAIAGAASVTRGVDGTQTATAGITGAATLTRAAAGGSTVTATIGGTASVALAGSGSVLTTATISGTAQLSRVLAGSATVVASISGSATVLQPGGVTPRLNTGTTTRPGSGLTTRPGSGLTTRPGSGRTSRPFTGVTSRP